MLVVLIFRVSCSTAGVTVSDYYSQLVSCSMLVFDIAVLYFTGWLLEISSSEAERDYLVAAANSLLTTIMIVELMGD
jgi:hypothetical protein